MRLANKVALITGAGSGFGAAMAERFAAEGIEIAFPHLTEDLTGEILLET